MLQKISLAILLTVSCALLRAQDTEVRETDWRLRTGAAVEYALKKNWSTEFNWESRWKDNITAYDKSFAEVGTKYKIPQGVKFHTLYRHYLEPQITDRYRLTLGVNYERFFNNTNLEWAVRIRWQQENDYGAAYDLTQHTFRGKLSLVYELTRNLGLVLEDELFYDFGDNARWDKNRLTSGIEWQAAEGWEFIAFYRFENELSRELGDFDHTIGLYAEYKFKYKDDDEDDEDKHFGHPYRY